LDKTSKFKSVDISKLNIISPQEREAIEKLSLKKWRLHLSKNQSIVSDVLMGQFLSKLECAVCKSASYNFEPFNVLELSLHPGKDTTTLTELLSNSTKEDLLEGFMWDCPKCLVPRQVYKSTHIYKLPPVLVVCYKRFDIESGRCKKNNCLVNMNIDGEDLSKFEQGAKKSGPKTYQPYMIIVVSVYLAPPWRNGGRAL
jgi:ubiquitin carboxyl-terminal hydrolase 8